MTHSEFARRTFVLLLIAIFAICEMYLATEVSLAAALIVLWITFLAIVIGSLFAIADDPYDRPYDPTADEFEVARRLRPSGNVDRVYTRTRGEQS